MKKYVFFIFFCLLILPNDILAQIDQIKEYWNRYSFVSNTTKPEKLNQIIDSLNILINNSEHSGDSCAVAYGIGRKGAFFAKTDNFIKGHIYNEKSIRYYKMHCVSDIRNYDIVLRNLAVNLNKYIRARSETIQYYEEIINLCFRPDKCWNAYKDYINLLTILDEFDSALKKLESFKAEFTPDSSLAFFYEYKSIIVAEREGSGDLELAIKLVDLASAQYRIDNDIDGFLKSQKLKATYLKDLHRLDEATAINLNLLKDKRLGKKDRAGILNNQANVYRRQKEYQKAYDFLFMSNKEYFLNQQMEWEVKSGKLSMVQDNFTEVFIDTDQLDSALQSSQKCLAYLFEDLNVNDYFKNPPIEQVQLFDLKDNLITRIYDKFRVHEAVYQQRQEERYLQSSLSIISLLDQLIDDYRWEQQERGTRLAWRYKLKDIYNDIINFTATNDELEWTFHFMEKSKAILLSDALPSQADINFADRNEIRKLKKLIDAAKRAESTDVLELDSLKNELAEYEVKLGPEGRNYFINKYQNQSITLKEAQRSLDKGQIAIQYHFSSDTTLLALLITQDQVRLKYLELGLQFDDNFDSYLHYVAEIDQGNFGQMDSLSLWIYNQIVAPLEIEEKNWIIVPDRTLALLPFAALLTASSANPNHRTKSYLIHDALIEYQYSLAIVSRIEERGISNNGETIIFTPDFDSIIHVQTFAPDVHTSSYRALINTEPESKRIQSLFDGSLFWADQANIDQFITHSPSSAILHIASHASSFPANPDHSHIVLKDEQNQYCALTLQQIYDMQLNSELVTLSACQTGRGKLEEGEGILSLGRAFLEAGARSVVHTLWSIDDFSTHQIMINFYQFLKGGKNKHDALRQSQIAYLQDSNVPDSQKHPKYWAAFSMSGDVQALSFVKSKRRLIYWLIIPILALAVFLIRNQKNAKTDAEH